MVTSFESGPITSAPDEADEGQEFNAYTLFGDYQPIFIDMLRFVEFGARGFEVDDDELLRRLRQHIDRGVRQLAVRIKSPADAAELIAGGS